MKKFTHYYQSSQKDCGATCLKMVAKFYGKDFSLKDLIKICQTNSLGASLLSISEGAETIGFQTSKVRLTSEQLINEAPLPAILHWNNNHYVVITAYRKRNKVIIADPAEGMLTFSQSKHPTKYIFFSQMKCFSFRSKINGSHFISQAPSVSQQVSDP